MGRKAYLSRPCIGTLQTSNPRPPDSPPWLIRRMLLGQFITRPLILDANRERFRVIPDSTTSEILRLFQDLERTLLLSESNTSNEAKQTLQQRVPSVTVRWNKMREESAVLRDLVIIEYHQLLPKVPVSRFLPHRLLQMLRR
eukprot:PhF_6_TR3488/c0_g1_i1/m.5122